jgi:peptide/nickel transport system substrate-binding protein
MLNLRYYFRLITAFSSRFKVLILVGIAFGIVFFFFLRFLIPLINSGQTLRIGEAGRYTVSSLPMPILKLIGDGLTKIDSEGSVVPSLALSWETTDKGKTWTFNLKDNVYWQDGTKVTSKSINYQFSDVTIERPNDKTIVFKLQNAYSAFPAVVSRPTFKTGLLGTSEWKVSKISLNGTIVEEISLVSKDKSKLIYKFYPTEERTKIAFELGQVDMIDDLFGVSPFDDWKRVKIDSTTSTGEFVAVFFNTKDEVLAEKNLRQALSYAIDKKKLGGVRAIGPISADSWAYNPQKLFK